MAPKYSRNHEEYLRRNRAAVRRNRAAARQQHRLSSFALLIAAIALTGLLVQGSIFVLSEIEVTGNSTKSLSEIAGLSGLRLGMNIFNVDKAEIERNFSADRSVELVGVRIEMPDTVVLEVKERAVRAAVNCAGVILLIDMDGYVLQRLSSVPQTQSIPVISGMDVRISTQGKMIESGTGGQIDAMRNVLSALYDTGADKIVSELNVSDPDNLYLVSHSGIQILIGDDEQMEMKLAWTQAVIDALTTDGIMSGIVDVSSGNNAVYSRM